MSDEEGNEKPFAVEVAKQGRAVCKKCKEKCLVGELRLAKLVHNPFGSGKMKSWHHIDCLFEIFSKQRQTTKRIESLDDIEGWDKLKDEDRDYILEKIRDCDDTFAAKFGAKTNKSPNKQSPKGTNPKVTKKNEAKIDTPQPTAVAKEKEFKDNLFREFRRLVTDIMNNSSYLDKTEMVRKIFTNGTDGQGFKGDTVLWCRLLLPGVVKRVYNLQSKQIVKLFSRIFMTDQEEMLEHLEQGDIGETINQFFEQSTKIKPAKKSLLTLEAVDKFLERLSKLTREEDQIDHFKSFIPKCTGNDLKTVIRLIKGDLRMGAGAKHILDGVHPDAYSAYQASRNLESVINKCLNKGANRGKDEKTVKADITLMVPVLPMLAEACKSVEQAMKKCPNGMYSEIKYDGERVQVHKQGSEFKYFSRHLKPVMPHKIQHFKDYIPKAFPYGEDLIIDSEILMMDCKTGTPLPFGTLGVHKKAAFKDASVCLFVFDCIYYNGECLINKPLSYRKEILKKNMIEIPNHIVLSEMEEIHKADDLARMIAKVLKMGLEGLVLKDKKSIYAPGKRHWLKVKKDYLFDGAMADSADLIVLGAWYGTGKKGGMMSVFLMGCYNPTTKKFCTVTKVHTGHDDKTLEELQSTLDMVKISQDPNKVPNWLVCTKSMIPDFVAADPKKQPVWEITGAEFTQHDVHTANGISIRFPRVTMIRTDKDWESATNLPELQKLYETSKESTDVSMLLKGVGSKSTEKKEKVDDSPVLKGSKNKSTSDESPTPKKKKMKKSEAAIEDERDVDNSVKDEPAVDLIDDPAVDLIDDPTLKYFDGVETLIEDKLKNCMEYAEFLK